MYRSRLQFTHLYPTPMAWHYLWVSENWLRYNTGLGRSILTPPPSPPKKNNNKSNNLVPTSNGCRICSLVMVLTYVWVSENWLRYNTGLRRSILAIPISQRAIPRPSTTPEQTESHGEYMYIFRKNLDFFVKQDVFVKQRCSVGN